GLLLLLGCGDSNLASVSGTVTYEGQPVEKGFISFLPEDREANTAGIDIIKGKYHIKGMVPGKKRVKITALAASEPPPASGPRNREAIQGKRLARPKPSDLPKLEPLLPANAIGNIRVSDIAAGSQTHDFTLQKPPETKKK